MTHIDNGTIAGISNDPGGNSDVTRAIHLANAGIHDTFGAAAGFGDPYFRLHEEELYAAYP